MQIQELVTEHLDIWTSALEAQKTGGRGRGKKVNGQDLYGVKKLRELILDLAVRGKLVPQDPEDEPASVLLEKIAEEKAQLIKSRKIKKQKKLPEITEEEKPFALPVGWEWTRLGTVGDWGAGSTPDRKNPDYYEGNMPWFKSGELNDNEHLKNSEETVTEKALKCCSLRICKHGDVLIAMYGATIGRLAILENMATTNQAVCACTCHSGVFNRYLFLMLMAWRRKFAGQGTGGAQPNISKVKIVNTVAPLPPLAEQDRLVTKVDELMALCDQLEQQQSTNNATHQTLLQTLLSTLTNSDDAEDFSTAWERIARHFDILFTTEQSIDQLQQTLLQLAVMGKIVPQNLEDEPASVLLEKIAKEKARLIKEGKIKKQKKLPEITEEEKPFALPEGWEWVRLGIITSKITDGDHKTPPRIPEGYRLLSAKNVRDGYLDFDNCDFISEQHYLKSRERCLPEAGDLLIVSVGGTIGRVSLVPDDSDFSLVRSVALIKPLLFDSSYLKHAMNSELLQSSIHNRKRGGAQPCLYLSEITQFMFSLPPLAEQHRIVAKVNELMTLCNQLKERLHNSQTTKLQLADIIVKQAVA